MNPDEDEQNNDLAVLHEYGQKKHILMEELKVRLLFNAMDRMSFKNYEESTEQIQSTKNLSNQMQPLIPPDTTMECTLELSIDRGLLLHIKVSNNIPIKAVLMFAEGIFPSECYAM